MSASKWIKMIAVGGGMIIGGPMLVNYVRPTEEELFQRFNPELQKRNLANREQRQKDFDDFVTQLKEHAKSDKNIWAAVKESEETKKQQPPSRTPQQEEKPSQS